MPNVSALAHDSDLYRTLLESTKAIPWKTDWATMKFVYIGPQIEDLLGWTPESWESAQDWAARMHPDDREKVVNFCVSQSQAGLDHEADYRALTKDNRYVWIRDVVHVLRNDAGGVEALVGFMFDISERKKTEDELLSLQKELEALSFKDGLTNIANRRRFDISFALEWERARLDRQPLSLLLFDVDFFKQYNDLYGHIQGDKCLIAIAQVLSSALNEPRDFVARYGGEEFVVLLPGADADAARKVAEHCQQLIQSEAIAHALSPNGRHVSVSIGVGSVWPTELTAPADFIKAVDQQLYLAKNNGRQRIESVQR